MSRRINLSVIIIDELPLCYYWVCDNTGQRLVRHIGSRLLGTRLLHHSVWRRTAAKNTVLFTSVRLRSCMPAHKLAAQLPPLPSDGLNKWYAQPVVVAGKSRGMVLRSPAAKRGRNLTNVFPK